MNYSLGNMLSGGKVLGPALNLQFATDQSLTARKGATPTFTRASTATFVGSDGLIQSAAINTARFESDGLLIEPQRTNSVLQPSAFDHASWSNAYLSAEANTTVSPDGLTVADTLRERAFTDVKITYPTTAFPSTIGAEYSISLFAKNGTRQFMQFAANSGHAVGNPRQNFDLANGVLGVGDAGLNPEIKPFGNGWYRCCVKMTAANTIFFPFFSFAQTASSIRNPVYLGVTSNTLFYYGAQFELGAYTTSLIPSNATRSADVCTLTIPAGVSSILITYGDNTTATVSVTPGGSYQLPASQKKYKSIVSL
jgi:hypothetical protein